MSNVAFCFPGQGSLEVGMGREIAEAVPEAMQVFREGSEASGLDLQRLCFDAPMEELVETEVQQPALVATSLAMLAALRARGLEPDYVVGHSVGEFTALAATSSMTPSESIALVRERGLAMAEAARISNGSMAAILGLDDAIVEGLCEDIDGVWPANYNCPGQIVDLRRAGRRERGLREGRGARRPPHGQAQGLRCVPQPAHRPRSRSSAPGDRPCESSATRLRRSCRRSRRRSSPPSASRRCSSSS